MDLRTWLSLTFGGFLLSTLLIAGVASLTISGLTDRITTVNHAGALSWRIDAVDRSRRAYQTSGSEDGLDATRHLISEAWPEMDRLRSRSGTDLRHDELVQKLQTSFERYGVMLDAYADSEAERSVAHEKMTIELNRLKSIATSVKNVKESEYHRTFASTKPVVEIEKQLRTALRLTVRIPTKPDGVSNREAGHRSDPKPDAIPI